MISIGKLYLDTINLKHPLFPVYEHGWTIESEEPFRGSKWCRVIWMPFVPLGLVIGWWGEPKGEEALYEAIGMREVAKVEGKPVGTVSEDVLDW